MTPKWQALCLLIVALLATAAVETASAAYAFQSASRAQILDLFGVVVQTDVLLKTCMSIAAGLAVVLGPTIAIYLWRRGANKSRRQAVLAIAVSVVGLLISVGNLSGYFAWTREQRAIEVAQSSPLYALAAANAARAAAGETSFLTGEDRRILREGQAQSTARRNMGDITRAFFILALISGMATAYRVDVKKEHKQGSRGARRSRRRRQTDSVVKFPRAVH